LANPFLLPNPFFKVRLTPNIQQPVLNSQSISERDCSDDQCGREFERLFSGLIGTSSGIALNSGRAALYLALKMLGIGKGDEVILPSLVCGAVADAIISVGAMPVLADVKPEEGTIDPLKIGKQMSEKTKAIIAVHYLGIPCDLDELREISTTKGVYLIEDCAHSLNSTYKNKIVGTVGDLAFFSFGPDKPLTTGLGGFLTSAHMDFARHIEGLRDSLEDSYHHPEGNARRIIAENNLLCQKRTYGISTIMYFPLARLTSLFATSNHCVGTALISRYASLVGIEQMKLIGNILKMRIVNASRLKELFEKTDFLKIAEYPNSKNPIFLRFLVLTANQRNRNWLMKSFKGHGIEAGPINWRIPLHRSEYYSRIARSTSNYEGTDHLCDRFLNIPCHPYLDDHDFSMIERAVDLEH